MGADDINRSRGLFDDLSREYPGNLLYWLNRQPHPESRYISVVIHDDELFGLGDLLVPEWSQDMNHVPALQGRALTVNVSGGHELNPADGVLLVDLLGRLQRS